MNKKRSRIATETQRHREFGRFILNVSKRFLVNKVFKNFNRIMPSVTLCLRGKYIFTKRFL